jgi:hypothetical protein
MHDQVQAAEVVEHGNLVAEHQQHVGNAQFVRAVPVRKLLLDVTDTLETEIANQAAAELRQAR